MGFLLYSKTFNDAHNKNSYIYEITKKNNNKAILHDKKKASVSKWIKVYQGY